MKLFTFFLFTVLFATNLLSQNISFNDPLHIEFPSISQTANQNIDTVINGLRYSGKCVNSKKTGPWYVRSWSGDNVILFVNYVNDKIISTYSPESKVQKFYNYKENKQYTIFTNDTEESVIYVDSLNEEAYGNKEVVIIRFQVNILDTTIGLKEINDSILTDRNNKKYPLGWEKFDITDHERTHEAIEYDKEGYYKLRKRRFKILMKRELKFLENNKAVCSWTIPEYTTSHRLNRLTDSILSIRKCIVTLLTEDESNPIIEYEEKVNNQKIIHGYFDKYGFPDGNWKLYHYEFLDPKGIRKSVAISEKNLFKQQFQNMDAPLVFSLDTKKLLVNTLSNKLKENFLNPDDIFWGGGFFSDYFTGIGDPYVTSKYATYKKTESDLVLSDNTGYHLFEQLYFEYGKLNRAYIYTPKGEIYDSINLNKDEFGEVVAKEFFNDFPEHPMANTYKEQLINGIKTIINTGKNKTNEVLSHLKCNYCSKKVDQPTVVFIKYIECGKTRNLHNAVFCSNQCRFEYEKGYCKTR